MHEESKESKETRCGTGVKMRDAKRCAVSYLQEGGMYVNHSRLDKNLVLIPSLIRSMSEVSQCMRASLLRSDACSARRSGQVRELYGRH